mmetsp:Transcript_60707/g.125029  ORF Transcript_60707/g.125029 Transcript_60707/m.125029 type:complete len:240 (+) Transcript_60707:204-923(+)
MITTFNAPKPSTLSFLLRHHGFSFPLFLRCPLSSPTRPPSSFLVIPTMIPLPLLTSSLDAPFRTLLPFLSPTMMFLPLNSPPLSSTSRTPLALYRLSPVSMPSSSSPRTSNCSSGTGKHMVPPEPLGFTTAQPPHNLLSLSPPPTGLPSPITAWFTFFPTHPPRQWPQDLLFPAPAFATGCTLVPLALPLVCPPPPPSPPSIPLPLSPVLPHRLSPRYLVAPGVFLVSRSSWRVVRWAL